jgi:hypothetical protein
MSSSRFNGCLLLCAVAAAVAGCATESELTAIRLDRNNPKFASPECQHSIAGSSVHTDVKNVSLLATPALLLVSGGLLLPVVAANAAIDYADRVDASNMSVRCGGKGKTQAEIVERVSTGAVIGVASNALPLPKPK